MTIDEAVQIAVQHHLSGRLSEAEQVYRQILNVAPQHAVALHNLGQIAFTVRNYDAAIDLLSRAIVVAPDDANAHNTLAATFFAVGRLDESMAELNRALELRFDFSNAHSNRGNVLVARGDLPAAKAAFEKAITLNSNNAIAHDGLGSTLLLTGELRRGWQEREWRWQKPDFEANRFAGRRRWDGSDVRGKTILLLVEQGYGDVFQLARYAPLLAARGAMVILEVVPDIHRLMSTLAGVDQLIIAGLASPPCDFVSPLMSLPYFFNTDLQSIPAATPYLSADPRLAESFKAKYFRSDPNLKIGLVWAGRPTHSNDHNRSMSLAEFAPLAELTGVSFYSLQKGPAAQQTPPPGIKLVDLSTQLVDFNWTAAAIAGLDLVITVDTAVSHLAGALDKPVWVLLPFIPDWRWMMDREDTPWYPKTRLFRQNRIGDWSNVVGRLAEAVRQLPRG